MDKQRFQIASREEVWHHVGVATSPFLWPDSEAGALTQFHPQSTNHETHTRPRRKEGTSGVSIPRLPASEPPEEWLTPTPTIGCLQVGL